MSVCRFITSSTCTCSGLDENNRDGLRLVPADAISYNGAEARITNASPDRVSPPMPGRAQPGSPFHCSLPMLIIHMTRVSQPTFWWMARPSPVPLFLSCGSSTLACCDGVTTTTTRGRQTPRIRRQCQRSRRVLQVQGEEADTPPCERALRTQNTKQQHPGA